MPKARRTCDFMSKARFVTISQCRPILIFAFCFGFNAADFAAFKAAATTKVEFSLHDLFNRLSNAFDYDYITRLPAEPSSGITNARDDA